MMAENLKGFDLIPKTIPHFCFESFTWRTMRPTLELGDVLVIPKEM